jgi:alanine racemase
VTIFGEDPTVGELAQILGTIPYEILTSVPRRIERIILRK